MRLRSRSPLVLLALLAAAPTLLVGATAGPAAAAAGVGVFSPWALQSENIGANKTAVPTAQAVADAKANDVLLAHPIAYRDSVAAMKRANPALKLYVYMNASYAQAALPDQSPQHDGDTRPSCLDAPHGVDCYWPGAWYLHDSAGNPVRSIKIGNWLMDITQPGWRTSRAQVCREKLADSGYDGCYLDMLGPVSLSTTYVTGHAIDPRSGAPWDLHDWIDNTAAVAGSVERAMNPTPVIGNGISSGIAYFNATNPTKRILYRVDGGLAESWLRGSMAAPTAFRPEFQWKQDVDMIVDAEKTQGRGIYVIYKLWATATQAQKDANRKYAMASFLMGAGGNSHFFFSDDPKANRALGHPWYKFAIGTPTQAYAKVGGVYRRTFTRGLALVNPTTTPVTVKLGATYTSISGARLSSVTLPPHTAEILRT